MVCVNGEHEVVIIHAIKVSQRACFSACFHRVAVSVMVRVLIYSLNETKVMQRAKRLMFTGGNVGGNVVYKG